MTEKAYASGTPERYRKIDFTPTEGMAKAAETGLNLRREYGRGGTRVGVARANQVRRRDVLSVSTVNRMRSFFARHRENRNSRERLPDGGPTNGWIAWQLWGGDAGDTWSKRKTAQMESADRNSKKEAMQKLAEVNLKLAQAKLQN